MSEENLTQDEMSTEHSAGIRIGKQLVNATAPYAAEMVSQSWWHVTVTFTLLFAALVGAGLAPWWQARTMLSIFAALLMVRAFITYHDYMHGAILSQSRLAWLLFRLYAAFALTPPHAPGKRATIIIMAMSAQSAWRVSAPSR